MNISKIKAVDVTLVSTCIYNILYKFMDEMEIQNKIADIENRMSNDMNFWMDSDHAQMEIKELRDLKHKVDGEKALDRGGCTMSILAGAGGDDSEDWARMLLAMYLKYADSQGWSYKTLH